MRIIKKVIEFPSGSSCLELHKPIETGEEKKQFMKELKEIGWLL